MVDYKFLADKAKKEWGKNFSADTMKLKYRWYKTKQRDGLLPCWWLSDENIKHHHDNVYDDQKSFQNNVQNSSKQFKTVIKCYKQL